MYNISTVTTLSTRPLPSFICHKEPNGKETSSCTTTTTTTRSSYTLESNEQKLPDNLGPCCRSLLVPWHSQRTCGDDDDDDYGKLGNFWRFLFCPFRPSCESYHGDEEHPPLLDRGRHKGGVTKSASSTTTRNNNYNCTWRTSGVNDGTW